MVLQGQESASSSRSVKNNRLFFFSTHSQKVAFWEFFHFRDLLSSRTYPDNTVSVIENNEGKRCTITHAVTDTLVGNSPEGVAIAPDGSFAYVANGNKGSTVSIIDTDSHTVTDNLSAGSRPGAVAIFINATTNVDDNGDTGDGGTIASLYVHVPVKKITSL